MALVRGVDTRYLGEAHEIAIPAPDPFDPAAAAERFHDAHERLYGYAYRKGEIVEFVNWKVTGVGAIERPGLEVAPPGGSGAASGARGRFTVYRRDDLPGGWSGRGPAIVEEYGATTVIEDGYRDEVDRFGNLVLHAD